MQYNAIQYNLPNETGFEVIGSVSDDTDPSGGIQGR